VKNPCPEYLKAKITCTAAINVNQGMIDTFSTGSQSQLTMTLRNLLA